MGRAPTMDKNKTPALTDMIPHDIRSPFLRLSVLALATLLILTGCSYETRDRLWRKLDPAGYKHSHSEVFNPEGYHRYQRRAQPDTLPPIDEAEVDLMR